MAIFAGQYTYKGHDVTFWHTPKMIKAVIWKPNSLILVKRFFSKDYQRLKRRVVHYLDTGKVMYG